MYSRVEGSKQNIKCWGSWRYINLSVQLVKTIKDGELIGGGGGVLFARPGYMLGLELCMCLRRTDVDS